MPTLIAIQEVEDAEQWANAWKPGPGSRHEMFAQMGAKVVAFFRDPEHPERCGIMADIPDMDKFQALMGSEEGAQAMAEDGVKPETIRVLMQFTP